MIDGLTLEQRRAFKSKLRDLISTNGKEVLKIVSRISLAFLESLLVESLLPSRIHVPLNSSSPLTLEFFIFFLRRETRCETYRMLEIIG